MVAFELLQNVVYTKVLIQITPFLDDWDDIIDWNHNFGKSMSLSATKCNLEDVLALFTNLIATFTS